jgi:hypothetical protein
MFVLKSRRRGQGTGTDSRRSRDERIRAESLPARIRREPARRPSRQSARTQVGCACSPRSFICRHGFDHTERLETGSLADKDGDTAGRSLKGEEAGLVLGNVDGPHEADARPHSRPRLGGRARSSRPGPVGSPVRVAGREAPLTHHESGGKLNVPTSLERRASIPSTWVVVRASSIPQAVAQAGQPEPGSATTSGSGQA